MKDWDVSFESDHTILKTRVTKRDDRTKKLQTIKAEKMQDLLPPPKPGEHYLIVTEKQFNAHALIIGLLKDREIDEMYLATYRLNEIAAESFIDMLESGQVKKASFVVSDFFQFSKRHEKGAVKLRTYCLETKKAGHVYAHNHAKVLAVRMGNDYYVFEGSGNMTNNARIEQYRYENCRVAFEFHRDWITELAE